jgi:large subunit ribosomal protein L25
VCSSDLDVKAFNRAIHTHAGHNVIINLKDGGSENKVIVKEIQRYPLDDSIIHVDFQRISMTEKIEVMVPVQVSGIAVGVKENGGVLEHMLREIKVRCLPTDIPEAFIVDVTKFDIGEGVAVKQISVPANVEVMTDKEMMVIIIVSSTKEEVVEAPAAAAVTAEPEVISKGKKEEVVVEGAKPAEKAKAGEKAKPAEKAAAPKEQAKVK